MIENLLPLMVFVSLMVGTPGPANLLMMTGGARYGVAACMPFNAGLILGKIGLNIAVGLGLGLVMADNPTVQMVMKLVSGAYMIWLAAKNWNAVAEVEASKSAYSFRNGIIVHPLNYGSASGIIRGKFLQMILKMLAHLVFGGFHKPQTDLVP